MRDDPRRSIAAVAIRWQFIRMKGLAMILLLVAACSAEGVDAPRVRDAQARSPLGSLEKWDLDTALLSADLQGMRDRAYIFCAKKPRSAVCEEEQDLSLFAYANSFRLVRLFRSEPNPSFSFAKAHKAEPEAFHRVKHYCETVYQDQGATDARSLGPCMSAGVGSDFFGLAPVD